MAEVVPVVDFQSPVPGAMADWSQKIPLVVQSYYNAGLLNISPGEKLIGRIGVDGIFHKKNFIKIFNNRSLLRSLTGHVPVIEKNDRSMTGQDRLMTGFFLQLLFICFLGWFFNLLVIIWIFYDIL